MDSLLFCLPLYYLAFNLAETSLPIFLYCYAIDQFIQLCCFYLLA